MEDYFMEPEKSYTKGPPLGPQSPSVSGTLDLADWEAIMEMKRDLHCSLASLVRKCVSHGLKHVQEAVRKDT